LPGARWLQFTLDSGQSHEIVLPRFSTHLEDAEEVGLSLRVVPERLLTLGQECQLRDIVSHEASPHMRQCLGITSSATERFAQCPVQAGMLGSSRQGFLEHLDGLVIAALRQQQFPWPQPLTARHGLFRILHGLGALLDFSSYSLQVFGGILELRLQRPRVPLHLGHCLFQAMHTYQEDTQAPERRHECQCGEGHPRDEPYQRRITHPTSQCPQHPQDQQHICQPLHAPLHTYGPSVSHDLSQHPAHSSHTLPFMCMLYTLWLAASSVSLKQPTEMCSSSYRAQAHETRTSLEAVP